jgi:hypothetical protein
MSSKAYWLIVSALVLALVALWISAVRAESTVQRDAPTVRFYTADGKSAGSATTYGNQTKVYSPDGKHVGTAVRQPGRK